MSVNPSWKFQLHSIARVVLVSWGVALTACGGGSRGPTAAAEAESDTDSDSAVTEATGAAETSGARADTAQMVLGQPPGSRIEVSAPRLLGPLAGPGARYQNEGLNLYGTDLGLTFVHDGQLNILFGDTWPDAEFVCRPAPLQDDALARLPMSFEGTMPRLEFITQPDDPHELRMQELVRDGESLPLGFGRVPLAGFSDGERAFAIFARMEPVRCGETYAACDEGDGFYCSDRIGQCLPHQMPLPLLCDAQAGTGCFEGQTCTPMSTCVDASSPQYGRSLVALTSSVAQETVWAVRRDSDVAVFDSVHVWPTNKFAALSARTVERFTGELSGNDYAPGHGELLVWGRPGFVAENGRQVSLYLMRHALPMPLSDDGKLEFSPLYFAGVDPTNNQPRWTERQSQAVPLSLDGEVNGDPQEALPMVGQMAISWVGEPINKWVMLYGGDMADYLMLDPVAARRPRSPGSIMIRFADHPWGPFTPPSPHLVPGEPPEGAYGPGGFLYHSACVDEPETPCAQSDPHRPADTLFDGCLLSLQTFDPGRLYGVNIIDAYTRPHGEDAVDLYWNLSTWNPYGVLLMRTTLTAKPPEVPEPPALELSDPQALARLSDWRGLPKLDEVGRYVQQTSRDRGEDDDSFPLSGHGNRDFNNFLCKSDDAQLAEDQFAPFRFELESCPEDYVKGVVLGRFEGSGRLVRSWIGMASLIYAPADEEILRIYVDDDPVPRVEVPLAAALDGSAGEIFAPPFGAGSPRRLAWYYPTVFRDKLIMTLDNLGEYDEYFYHLDVVYDEVTGEGPISRSRLPERDEAAIQLAELHHPAGTLRPLEHRRAVVLEGQAEQSILARGPATIHELQVTAKEEDIAALADVELSVYWDGARQPAIELPLLSLFAVGGQVPELSSPALSTFVEGGARTLALRLPMPFNKFVHLHLKNHGTDPIAFLVDLRGEHAVPEAPFGYLHVQQRETAAPTEATHHIALEASGRGRLAGVCTYVQGVPDPDGGLQYDPLNLLEGDLQIEVDGEIALDGTGSEEYADDVFYFADAPHATVFAQAWGRFDDFGAPPGHASFCRWHVLGTELDFRSSLRVSFERGGAGNPEIAELHRSVSYLYLPSPAP